MVLLVLAAMVSTSNILRPYLNSAGNEDSAERYRELAKYLLLNTGAPSDWGQDGQTLPTSLGLAEAGEASLPYELDVDKVSRLNSRSVYSLRYYQMFDAVGMPDVSFRIRIQPIFEVSTNLTAVFPSDNATAYQFEILTHKHGVAFDSDLACYAIAENCITSSVLCASEGKGDVNVTLPNEVSGPGLLVVFARSISNGNIASVSTYSFAHGSAEPTREETFLRLSPLNYSLNISFACSGLNLTNAYALTFSHNSTLAQVSADNESAVYTIPRLLAQSSTVLVVTGRNSTAFFEECVTYAQVPLEVGTDITGSASLTDFVAFTCLVAINSALYECTVWVGGLNE
jgi:hypothetical protein